MNFWGLRENSQNISFVSSKEPSHRDAIEHQKKVLIERKQNNCALLPGGSVGTKNVRQYFVSKNRSLIYIKPLFSVLQDVMFSFSFLHS